MKLRGHSTASAAAERDAIVRRRSKRWGERDIEIDLGFWISWRKKGKLGELGFWLVVTAEVVFLKQPLSTELEKCSH